MAVKSISQAIAISVAHTEIARVNLSDLLQGLRHEAEQARDFGTVEAIDSVTGEEMPVASVFAGLVALLIANAESAVDATDTDDVENDDVWEMWGRAHDGDYRVHIRLDR